MDTATSQLQPLFVFLAYSLAKIENTFNSIPGSAVIARYARSSHQNDPYRNSVSHPHHFRHPDAFAVKDTG